MVNSPPQKCPSCDKYFKNLPLHLSSSEKCPGATGETPALSPVFPIKNVSIDPTDPAREMEEFLNSALRIAQKMFYIRVLTQAAGGSTAETLALTAALRPQQQGASFAELQRAAEFGADMATPPEPEQPPVIAQQNPLEGAVMGAVGEALAKKLAGAMPG